MHNIHCHHKVTRYMGGNDTYQNLMLITETVDRLIHAQNATTIQKYMDMLHLTKKQIDKLNRFRNLANVESCLNVTQ